MPPRLDDLDPRIASLFGGAFAAAHEAIDSYTRARVEAWAASLVDPSEWAEGLSLDQLQEKTDCLPEQTSLLRWLLDLLEAAGTLRQANRETWSSPEPLQTDPAPVAADLRQIGAPTWTVVDLAADALPDVLAGRRSGEDVLFSSLGLWFDYFSNANVLYAPNNRLAAMALGDLGLQGRDVLELGGGAGSAAQALLDEIESRGSDNWPHRYHFSELVPAFGRRGGRDLRRRAGDRMEVVESAIDFDRPLAEQDLATGSCDVVWAVNALHVARDLEGSLTDVHRILRPGGVLVLGECIRPKAAWPLYTEFGFNFLETWRRAQLTERRTSPGFLSAAEWRECLGAAGFSEVQFIPDIETIQSTRPAFVAAAVVASV